MEWFFGSFLVLVVLALVVGTIWMSLPSKVLGDIEESLSERKKKSEEQEKK